MTLDISQFIANSIRNQSKIHHLDINVKATSKNDIPQSVISLITNDYGEKYLNDADYVAFFWGAINKEHIEKLFNVVDKALGKSANKLTDKDFKRIKFNPSSDETPDDDSADENIEDNDIEDTEDTENNDSENTEDIEDIKDTEDNDSEDIEDEVIDTDEDDSMNEDDEEIEIDAKIEQKPNIPNSYFFLKITLK